MKKGVLAIVLTVLSVTLVLTACSNNKAAMSQSDIDTQIFKNTSLTPRGQNGRGSLSASSDPLYRNIAYLSAKKNGLDKTTLDEVIHEGNSSMTDGLEVANYNTTHNPSDKTKEALEKVNNELKSVKLTETYTTSGGKKTVNGSLRNGDKYKAIVKDGAEDGVFKTASQTKTIKGLVNTKDVNVKTYIDYLTMAKIGTPQNDGRQPYGLVFDKATIERLNSQVTSKDNAVPVRDISNLAVSATARVGGGDKWFQPGQKVTINLSKLAEELNMRFTLNKSYPMHFTGSGSVTITLKANGESYTREQFNSWQYNG